MENMEIYLKYQQNLPVSLFTQNLLIPEGEEAQVFDLITASTTEPTRKLLGLPIAFGSLSIQLPLSIPRSSLTEDCFINKEGTTLDPSCPLSLLGSVGSSSRNPLIVAVETAEPILTKKRSLFEQQDVENYVKKRRLSNDEFLMGVPGGTFPFYNREGSHKILADGLMSSFSYWKAKRRDKELHPIPFLAEGSGTGKTRYLQELPNSFKSFVLASDSYSNEFKEAINSAIYINVTFTDGTPYYDEYHENVRIETLLALRIAYQLNNGEHECFYTFYEAHKDAQGSLDDLLMKIGRCSSCFVLGIDGVNLIQKTHLKNLFDLMGYFRSSLNPFFVPIIAGAVIEPLSGIFSGSSRPPLHIPLSFLSMESCQKIIATKDPSYEEPVKKSLPLRQLIAETGGHGRTLETLFNYLPKTFDESCNWDEIASIVKDKLRAKYALAIIPFGTAVAYSFLSIGVGPRDRYPEANELTFENLEEKALIKLDRGQLQIPQFYVRIFLDRHKRKPCGRLWKDVLLGKNFHWKSWETFNANYFAFRLSLHSYLGTQCIRLDDLFKGAIVQKSRMFELKIKIPETIQVHQTDKRFPTSSANEWKSFGFGTSVLNAAGAPFDSFMFVETSMNQPLLLAFQTKWTGNVSKSNLALDDNVLEEELDKMKESIEKNIQGMDFVAIIISRYPSNFKKETMDNLEGKCIVISETEFLSFYGTYFYERLKITDFVD